MSNEGIENDGLATISTNDLPEVVRKHIASLSSDGNDEILILDEGGNLGMIRGNRVAGRA